MKFDSEKIMTFKYLSYELLGTMILSLMCNLTGFERAVLYPVMLLPVSIWAWNHSCAHFNMAITFGELVFSSQKIAEVFDGLKAFAAIAFAQFIGGLTAILITFLISTITYNATGKTVTPAAPTLCPTFGCADETVQFEVFIMELITSFALILSFLIVRYTQVKELEQRWMTFIGPLLISLITGACVMISATTANSLINPSLALEVLIWSAGAHNQKDNPQFPNKTEFQLRYYGRYAWIYLIVPFVSSILAALFAKKHVAYENERKKNKKEVEDGLVH